MRIFCILVAIIIVFASRSISEETNRINVVGVDKDGTVIIEIRGATNHHEFFRLVQIVDTNTVLKAISAPMPPMPEYIPVRKPETHIQHRSGITPKPLIPKSLNQ